MLENRYVNEYIKYLEVERNYSLETIKNYERDIEEFFSYCGSEGINYLRIKYDDARFYVMYLKDKKNNSSSSISRKISSLRSFYRYLLGKQVIDINVFHLVTLPKKSQRLPKFFSYDELEELFVVPNLDTSIGQRDALILEMLYATGVRVSELVNIKVKDITISDNSIKVLGKGNKERMVYFQNVCKKRLNLYLKDGYLDLNKKKSDYLFLNHNGEKITTRGVEYILDKIIKETSLNKNISPHMLRHSFATHLLNEGCELTSVQELLGHESLTATSIYTHVTSDRLKEVYYKTHPRARKCQEK